MAKPTEDELRKSLKLDFADEVRTELKAREEKPRSSTQKWMDWAGVTDMRDLAASPKFKALIDHPDFKTATGWTIHEDTLMVFGDGTWWGWETPDGPCMIASTVFPIETKEKSKWDTTAEAMEQLREAVRKLGSPLVTLSYFAAKMPEAQIGEPDWHGMAAEGEAALAAAAPYLDPTQDGKGENKNSPELKEKIEGIIKDLDFAERFDNPEVKSSHLSGVRAMLQEISESLTTNPSPPKKITTPTKAGWYLGVWPTCQIAYFLLPLESGNVAVCSREPTADAVRGVDCAYDSIEEMPTPPHRWVFLKAAKASDPHEWWVYSTAVGAGSLMVECKKTGELGVIKDPTKEEWRDAFHAPSNPYRWGDNSRVVIHDEPAADPTKKFSGIFDILTTHAGTPEALREEFIAALQRGTKEFRIGGSLAFGGKYWPERNEVNCYPEDLTEERKAIIETTNRHLAEMENDDEEVEDDEPTVPCKFCHDDVPEKTAHLHDGEYVGDDCCWEERLRSTE